MDAVTYLNWNKNLKRLDYDILLIFGTKRMLKFK